MLFNSLSFGYFLPVVFALYWIAPHRFRWGVLLAASYFFYMSWNVKYVVLILFTTAVSYVAALLMEQCGQAWKKKLILAFGVIVSLGVLFLFKYMNFANRTLAHLFAVFSVSLPVVPMHLLLPVGISFYTFQTLSYVIDVYRGEIPAEKHFGIYALFVSFFPQLVAGPIERTGHLMPQLKAEHHFDQTKAVYGMKRMAWGFFKKMVVADVLAEYADMVFNAPEQFEGFAVVMAMFFFSIQIYCDFSAYSDIAIGAAKLLDIDLIENFASPYFSGTIHEWWSRWHISLSSWFRDYVYIPLGGNRKSPFRKNVNLLITFLLSGLWHGADWTYVLWGGYHGMLQIFGNMFPPKRAHGERAVRKVARTVWRFLLWSIGWVIFRANQLGDVLVLLKNMFAGITDPFRYFRLGMENMQIPMFRVVTIFCSIVLLAAYDMVSQKAEVWEIIGKWRTPVRYGVYCLLLAIIILWRSSGENAFVYFQF